MTKNASCALEQALFNTIEEKTPDYIKNRQLLNLNNKNEFEFILKKEHLYNYDANTNPEGLGLLEWFANYEKEAKVSTAGIRGPQNVLYPEDTRFPINKIGILLATLAKGLVAKAKYPSADLRKLAASEVRYNSKEYLELIARIQAALGIKTYIPVDYTTIPIWMASFLVFKLDLLGGEYITSSHGISVKNATKDLNDQGSQYLPEESIEFVDKIKEIFDYVEKNGEYKISISSTNDAEIDQKLMAELKNGVDLYVDYLKHGVATEHNLELIKNVSNNIIIESVGGSAYATLSKVLEGLNVADSFEWLHTEEDPFFHSIGKSDVTPKGEKAFYDWSVDAAVMVKKDDNVLMPVIESLHYDASLAAKPVGTVVLITDPDHDRLTVTQFESVDNIPTLKKLGIDYVQITADKVLAVYTANQSFLMTMSFWAKSLKANGIFDKHPRFMIKTTASAMSWDEWAEKNGIKVVNVPVGFKEIANVMKKVEAQIKKNPDKEVSVEDVFGKEINLGVQPRLIFGGEESGGMIIGAEKLIESKSGRVAVAMREKSATEAIMVNAALVSECEKNNIMLSQYLADIFEQNDIKGKFDVREDISYYNESEPDIDKLKIAKKEGEAKRTKNDLFYLTLVMAKKDGIITLDNVKEILSDTFKELDFSGVKDALYVGDGSYFRFDDKYIEIRPSGTDAKTKAYSAGTDKAELSKYARIMGNYSGDRTETYNKYVSDEYYQNVKDHSLEVYIKWANKGADFEQFQIPTYEF
jgi:phosphomannomutase